MIFRLGFRDFKRTLAINLLVILLLVAVFFTAISIVSAVEVKFKKYFTLSQFMGQQGIYIESYYLATEQNGVNYLLRDEAELREHFPNINSVLAVEQVWDVSVIEQDMPITLWCYSETVIDTFSPSMKSGRWFQDADMNSDILKAVVTYNEGELNPGDIVTLTSTLSSATEQVEIIGVMQNNESLFYTDLLGESYEDYRDCYYTYNYEAEDEKILMIIADPQILNGESQGKFSTLNYRLSPTYGFQKEMSGGTLITYGDDVSQASIDQDVETLKGASYIYRVYNLSDMYENSWAYILEELHNYFPVFICIFIFVIIAAVSANAITVKKQLRNYAVYYICGLPWKNCAKISLCVAGITSVIAFVIAWAAMFFLNFTDGTVTTALHWGLWQFLICAIIILCYILLAWSIPLCIVKNTSAKEIMTNNH